MSVDVAINVYGKPFQTAIALLSLVRHSGQHIGKIYFIEEAKQPARIDFSFIRDLMQDRIEVYRPKYWLWCNQTERDRLGDAGYRRSLRYQYAWEASGADYLFLTHNDVLYEGDIIGDFLSHIGDNVAIGEIGQCWNCPASSAGLCGGDRYLDFRPSTTELEELYAAHPSDRVGWEKFRDDMEPWPLPECRLNEWAALIDLKKVKTETMPIGDAFPFGAMTLDIGTKWFRQMSVKGFTFLHRPIAGLATHGWTLGGGGHQALFAPEKYDSGERMAFDMLVKDYGLDPLTLNNATRVDWRSRVAGIFRKR
jgi:hypothetical protein